jgi:ABC-type nitrate/sulfonate/bicarbonate transport system permease component
MKLFREFLPAVLVICGLGLVWQICAQTKLISPAVLPAPSRIIQALWTDRRVVWDNTLQTVLETLIGLGIAVVLGVLSACAIFLSSKLRKAVYPLLVISQTVPLIALAPLLLVWFGFGLMPKVVIVVLYCFFPITIAVADGLAGVDRQLVDLLKSMRASRWQTLRYVQLPTALPAFFSGLKISSTYAVTGAIVGEYVGAYRGLGIYMQAAAHSGAIDLVFASIFVIVLLSLILLSAVSFGAKVCMPWRDGVRRHE